MSCVVGDRTFPQELSTINITDYRAQVLGYQTDVLRTGRQAWAAWRVTRRLHRIKYCATPSDVYSIAVPVRSFVPR